MRTVRKRSITLIAIVLMLLAGGAQAEFVVTNGDFEVDAVGAGNVADVSLWYDNNAGGFWDDAWQSDLAAVTANGTQVVVFSGNDAAAGGSYLYQSIGTSMGEASIWIGFDWGHPDDTGAGRHDGITVSVLASDGTFEPNEAVDVRDANGITLLDSASYEHTAEGTDGEIWPVVVELDLSGANEGDEIFLCFNNTSEWPILDNVEITTEPKTIVWVTGEADSDEDGIQDDISWVDWLTGLGYIVDFRPGIWAGTEVDPNNIAALEAADLVMISRRIQSGDPKAEIFNPIATPIINLNAWTLRTSRLKWLNSGSALKYNGAPWLTVEAGMETHPIYAGVDVNEGLLTVLDPNVGAGEASEGNTSFVDIDNAGNGTVLGKALGMIYGQVFVAEWAAGVEYYDGAGEVAGGARMAFMAGTQDRNADAPDQTIPVTSGVFNLSPVGAQMMANAIEYMIAQVKPVAPDANSITHMYTFEDGTADDLVGDANGVLVGDANIIDGALVTVDQDDWMEMPGDVIDINSYDAATMEAWYTPAAGGNTSWSMLAYLGSNAGGVGQNGWFITSARADDKCRAAISTGSTSPWADESGVDRPGNIDDGMLHHMVSTLDAEEITFYIDGVLIGSTPLADADNSLSALSNQLVYLAKGGYDGDPEWIGAIHSFKIYNKALSAGEVLYNYIQGE